MKRSLHAICILGMLLVCHMPAKAQTSFFTHTISKGETLYAIARTYNVDINVIYELNPDARKGIKAGAVLRIPQKQQSDKGACFHSIAQGETLYRLTQIYHVTAEAICEANPGLTANNFRTGTVVRIPAPSPTDTIVSQPQEQPATAQPSQGLANSGCKEMHKVRRKETLYSISREYGITVEELKAANPETKDPDYKLKKGKFLCIPYPQKPAEKKPVQPVVQPSNNELFPKAPKKEHMELIRAAVILPFKTNDARSARMVEFYQGFLLAVDSLKNEGTSVEVFAFDSGKTQNDMKKVLANTDLTEADIIFGPMYAEQIPMLSDFCKQHKIKLVVPFTAQFDALYHNPYLYAINANKTMQYALYAEVAVKQFGNDNIILLDSKENDVEGVKFVENLNSILVSQGLKAQRLTIEYSDMDLMQALNPFRNNIIIPNTSSIKLLNQLIPRLRIFCQQRPEYRITLAGFPEWQTYTEQHLNNFYQFNAHVFTPFYRNPFSDGNKQLDQKFTYWFKKQMINSYPRFCVLGFDAGYFFLHGLTKYGTAAFDDNLPNMKSPDNQHSFDFKRVSNWGGWVNKSVKIIRYTPEQNIEITESKL